MPTSASPASWSGGCRAAMPVDAVYLDLHGAMVSEPFEDGEGELLRRVRAAVGPSVPIAISLDYHSNVTPEMVNSPTAWSAIAPTRTWIGPRPGNSPPAPCPCCWSAAAPPGARCASCRS